MARFETYRGSCRGGELVEGAAAKGRRPDDEEHLFRGEEHGPEVPGQGRGSAGHAVYLDPLPAGLESHLESDLVRGRPAGGRPGRAHRRQFGDCRRVSPRIRRDHDAFDAQVVGTPADQLGVCPGAVGSAQREHDDGLQEGRLAGCVGAPNELRPGPQRQVQRGVTAQVAQDQGTKQGRRLRLRPDGTVLGDLAAPGGGWTYDVVFTGMTTWT